MTLAHKNNGKNIILKQRKYKALHWTSPIIGTKQSSSGYTNWSAWASGLLTTTPTPTTCTTARSPRRSSSFTAIADTTKCKIYVPTTATRNTDKKPFTEHSVCQTKSWSKKEHESAAHRYHITDLVFGHIQSPSCCHAFTEASPRPLPLALFPSTSGVISSSPPYSAAPVWSSLLFDSAIKTPMMLPWKSLSLNHSTAAYAACGSS